MTNYCSIVKVCPGEEPDCTLYATHSFSKYLDCPLVNYSTDAISSGGVTNEVVNISWCITSFILHNPGYLCIDRYGVYRNNTFGEHRLMVTNSGQLYIPRVNREMRRFIYECTVWDGQRSQTQMLQPLRVLYYGMYNIR